MADADLIFRGGRLFTAGLTGSIESDVAVRDGRIVAVGPSAAALGGPTTEVVDARGRLLMPGFIDAHVHPVQAGVELLQCELGEATDAAQALALIGEYARAHPAEEWILGGGWAMAWFPGGNPTAAALDAIVGDRPVALSNRDHHGLWVSSAALRLAGITASTPDPADGRIERRADGAPSGMLHEGAAALLDGVLPEVSADLAYRGLLAAQARMHSFGVTGWQDAMIGGYIDAGARFGAAYLRAAARGELTARVTGALWLPRDATRSSVGALVAVREQCRADPSQLAFGAVKIMMDGVAENRTAALSQPYLDGHGHATGESGIGFFDPEVLKALAVDLEAAGFDLHFHALGDRAVTEALDAIEAARAVNGIRDTRHQLAHLQMVRADDVPRFARLGAAANIQSLWASHEPQFDELTVPFIAPELIARTYPFGDLERAGARFAAGSDWPVTSPDPLAAVRVAVTRVSDDAPAGAGPLGGAAQRLSLASALTAYTAGSAWVNRREHETGRIESGFLADLALLDRDPFALPPEEIDSARVLGTWIGGRQVFAAA
ncbi:amidohydrolase [Gryllotalpicola protaetiae]|uniref:Amidohydrolase n=1 Tax=Gryllotalpicola protaetiae TaxID=2419771 RepID=A0A387BKS0_9MICO|nr:amidohydrolase [Gryllotalpicola protaetiae]AYG03258.1 amidohydrolase [Gryllotalpicola protaetiae]